jgi:hypothetical protein
MGETESEAGEDGRRGRFCAESRCWQFSQEEVTEDQRRINNASAMGD